MKCAKCGTKIHPERAKIFKTCVRCTKQTKKIGFMDYGGQTEGAELCMIDSSDKDTLNNALKYFRVVKNDNG